MSALNTNAEMLRKDLLLMTSLELLTNRTLSLNTELQSQAETC